jgi:hypothetical protein
MQESSGAKRLTRVITPANAVSWERSNDDWPGEWNTDETLARHERDIPVVYDEARDAFVALVDADEKAPLADVMALATEVEDLREMVRNLHTALQAVSSVLNVEGLLRAHDERIVTGPGEVPAFREVS